MKARSARLGLATLVALSLLVAATAGPQISDTQKERLVEAIGKRLERKAFALQTDFSQWDDHVEQRREAIDDAQSKQELSEALNAALEAFELSHLSILAPDDARLGRKGKRIGLGVALSKTEFGFLVTYVLQESPAWRSGIRKGDTLTHVDETPIQSISQLRGTIGEEKRLSWARGEARESNLVEYAPFPVADRSSMRWLNEEVALIQVHSFQFRFYNANRINRFMKEARRAKAIVLDLRGNAGGLALYSRHLASKISDRSKIFSRHVNKRRIRRLDTDTLSIKDPDLLQVAKPIRPLPFSRRYDGQIIVLVDGHSASGGDLFPAFVQDSGRGLVVGTRTAGALQLARTFRLPYGFRLYAPIAEVLSPNGRRIEGEGVAPDIELSLPQTVDDAIILKTALEQIK